MSFVHYNGKIVNTHDIASISFEELTTKGQILVKRIGVIEETVSGIEAVNLIMRLCPEALEGQQLKYLRHRWAIHNLLGHPLMQILSWLHLTRLGLKIHDKTIPNPIIK